MKTKTQQQLEKEIEKYNWNIPYKNDNQRLQKQKEIKAKLSQHLTDIKQIEKYLDMRLKDFKERKPKLIDDISKYAMQMSIDLLKEIKEALKEL